MRLVLALALALVGCNSSGSSMAQLDAPSPTTDTPAPSIDAAPIDGHSSPIDGFGTLGGSGCGAITLADLTGPTPRVLRATFDFTAMFMSPADRAQLTPGGQHLDATPNAGGSSGNSETFAYEELARCDAATFLKSETEIVYDTTSKKTDLEVSIQGHKIGVSVTRAFTYPLGTAYTMQAATNLLTKKLGDILLSTASVSAADRWDKQFLAMQAFDDDAANLIESAWAALDPSLKADTIVIVAVTGGPDDFIYTNQ